MTDWTLAFRLSLIAVAAAVIAVPAQLRAGAGLRRGSGPQGTVMPVVLVGVMTVGAAVVGTVLATSLGLSDPVLRASAGVRWWPSLASAGWAGILGGCVAALLIPAYYLLAPKLDQTLFLAGEQARIAMGLPARVAFGGIVEEIVFRWAVLCLVAWLTVRVTGELGTAVQWISIVVAALAFGAAHLPGAAQLGGTLRPGMGALGLALNAWLGIIAGWLVWHHGLVAAMVAHGTVHVVWFLIERARAGVDA